MTVFTRGHSVCREGFSPKMSVKNEISYKLSIAGIFALPVSSLDTIICSCCHWDIQHSFRVGDEEKSPSRMDHLSPLGFVQSLNKFCSDDGGGWAGLAKPTSLPNRPHSNSGKHLVTTCWPPSIMLINHDPYDHHQKIGFWEVDEG